MRRIYNKLPIGYEAQLAGKCIFMPTSEWFWGIKTSKVGQDKLVLGF